VELKKKHTLGFLVCHCIDVKQIEYLRKKPLSLAVKNKIYTFNMKTVRS